MALLRCLECKTLYSVGAESCPQCGSAKQVEEGAPAPRQPKKPKPNNG